MTTRTLAELAALCGAELQGDGSCVVEGPASLLDATPREISFLAHPKYRAQLDRTRACAVVVSRDLTVDRSDLALLRCADPNSAFTQVVRAFAGEARQPAAGVHPSAVVDPTAEVPATAIVGPLCVIGPRAKLGAYAHLVAGVILAEGVSIGSESVLHPGVVLYARTEVGARCVIHAGAVLGADGYGFEPTKDGWNKIPQCGNVIVGDDVEIGANTTIDRGRFGATRIGRGAKLDNLVHVAHNVVVGDAVLLVAQAGISGSTRIGDRAILGGQVGVAGHVEIGAGARIAAQAGVFGDVPAGADYLGFPAEPRIEALRTLALTRKLPKLLERLKELEARVGTLEGRNA